MNYRAEASQLEYTIKSFGIRVVPAIAYDSASLAPLLAQHPVFLIPEQERGPLLADSMSAGAQAVLRQFVDSAGGTLVILTDYSGRGLELVNRVWGHSLATGFYEDTYALSGGAANTAFAGGSPRIWDNDATYSIDPSSLPANARIVYQGDGGPVVVAFLPEGRGSVILLAYDWYNAAPHGSQDGGWIEVLRRALRS